MSKSTNKVTIGIPTLNRRRYLESTLSSAMAQTYQNIEVIVSNNGSSGDTAAFLGGNTDLRVRVLNQSSVLSIHDNWNACLRAATGTYFLLLSDDDLLEPDAVAELVAAIEQAPNPERVGFAYSRHHFINNEGGLIHLSMASPEVEDPFSLVLAMFRGLRNISPCCSMMRTADMLPGYSSRFCNMMDNAMWIKVIMRHGEARFVDKPIAKYRIHENTTAQTPLTVLQQDMRALGEFAIQSLLLDKQVDATKINAIRTAVEGANMRITQRGGL